MHNPIVCLNQTNKSSSNHNIRSTRFSPVSSCFVLTSYRSRTHLLLQTLVASLFLLLLPAISLAAQVTLQWDQNDPAPDGYCVYQRLSGSAYDYDNPVWPADGNPSTATTCTIGSLTEGQTYHFVVRANVGNTFSGNSNEVTYQVPASQPPAQNQAPVAEAGNNQSAQAGTTVSINGSGSSDPDGDALSYRWTQSSGTAVILNGANAAQCTFTAPDVAANTTLSFELTVTDGSGLSDSDTCLVLVSPAQQEPDNDNDGIPDAQDPDDDNDGMPDTWENRYGLNTFVNDAGDDADNDGITNLEEYQEGTNPTVQDGNRAPLKPTITSPGNGDTGQSMTLWLQANAFNDPNPTDSHDLTQWEIKAGQMVVLDIRTTENDLTKLKVPRMVLDPSTQYTARVRYFDSSEEPSPWSDSVTFTTDQDHNDQNNNRIPDDQEVSSHTDMNRDGTPDISQETTIKSVQTFDDQYLIGVTIGTNATGIESASSVDPTTLETLPPKSNGLAYGLVGYKINVSKQGDVANSTIYLSDPVGSDISWGCYDSVDGWRDCTDTTTVDGDGLVVTRTLQDGGAEDADGTANGVIVDLSGPAVAQSSSPGSSLDMSDGGTAASGGGGGAGCFIGSVFGSK
jgi:hypothetical protein